MVTVIEGVGEHHTCRTWGSRARKKQLDDIMGPRDLHSTTKYLNKVRLRSWDHFLVMVRIDGKDQRKMKRMGGRMLDSKI